MSDKKKLLLDQLINDMPLFHLGKRDNEKYNLKLGELTNWSVQDETLWYIFNCLNEKMNTMETGSGKTTVLFAIMGCNHTCVTPEKSEINRIKTYCYEKKIDCNVNFLIGRSDFILPNINIIPFMLDFVIIDGDHCFPSPILDWHFMSKKLKINGLIALDDYKMPSVKILYDFLSIDNNWELVEVFQNTAFFRKCAEIDDDMEWFDQTINFNFRGW